MRSGLVALQLLLLLGISSGVAFAGSLSGPVVDEGLRVEVEDVVRLPATSLGAPRTRINLLRQSPDGTKRLFVNDLRGPLYVIDRGVVETYLNMRLLRPAMNTGPGISSGFVSFAFHPDFARNGLFYTVHTELPGEVAPNLGPAIPTDVVQHAVLTEWAADDPFANSFTGSSRELIRVAAVGFDHNLGEVAFSPSARRWQRDYGLLYVMAGEYTSVHSGEADQLQRLDTPYGAILRIDPLGGSFERDGVVYPYGIPRSNPFARDHDPDTLDEIFAFGTRNAHRIAWDPKHPRLAFVSDIGQANLEEINLLVRGANYGWPIREGTYALDVETDSQQVLPLPEDDDSLGLTYPVAQYDHEEGRAIAGGIVYRGSKRSELYGAFVFGDIVTGRLFYSRVEEMLCARRQSPDATATVAELHLTREGVETTLLDLVGEAQGAPSARADLRFGTDARGDVFLTTKRDGWVRRLALEAVQGELRRHAPPQRGRMRASNGRRPDFGICHERRER